MAKKNKYDKEFVAALDVVIDELKVLTSKDPIIDKVLSFRGKGYNDNQIASLLGIPVQQVKEIK